MRKITCHSCANTEVALNDSLKIDDCDYCGPCLEKHFPDEASVEGKKVVKHLDPTVCAQCATDFGDTVLPKLAHYPICAPCEIAVKNRTFPVWVKAFLGGIAALVVFSIFWNWKYYQGYADLQAANEFAAVGDYTKGAVMMRKASQNVPEVEDLKTLTNYYEGLGLLQQDQSAKALPVLLKCQGKLPDDFGLPSLILGAQSGIAFDKKDYDGFLKANQELFAKDSTVVDNWYGVASAYSCLYATKGKEADKTQALHYLAGAHKIDSTSENSKLYRGLITYRLANQKVITRQEYIKKISTRVD